VRGSAQLVSINQLSKAQRDKAICPLEVVAYDLAQV